MIKNFFKWLSIFNFLTLVILITILLYFLSSTNNRLLNLGQTLDDLANQVIDYEVEIATKIPVDTYVEVLNPMDLSINMAIRKSIAFDADIPINQLVKLPLDLPLKQKIDLKTSFVVPDSFKVAVNGDIDLNQKMKVFLIGKKGINMRVAGKVSINKSLKSFVPDSLNVLGQVPIAIRVKDSITVPLKMKIPISLNVPVDLSIQDFVKAKLLSKVHFKGIIPIKMKVPVHIPLRDTPLYEHLQKMKKQLTELLYF